MIYVTRSVSLEQLSTVSNPSVVIEREFNDMARDRHRIERDQLARQPGAVLPPVEGRRYGDVVMVMVDAGAGAETSRLIAQKLAE